ncbi:MAG: glycosyltransferase [Paludibacter sp.]|nr:glycosyltransferase [Paludibacter sp.]
MKKRVLFSITSQFGYHTDTYMYCKYLDKAKYDVHYAGFDLNYERRYIDDVTVHYIKLYSSRLKRYSNYILEIHKIIRQEKFDILFLVDCQATLLIRLTNLLQNTVLDIRTGDVFLKDNRLSVYNIKLLLKTLLFKNISIISDSLRRTLHINKHKSFILPLGGEIICKKEKVFDPIVLFYIGVFRNRNIEQTIEGLMLFRKEFPEQSIKYHLVGYGTHADESNLKSLIEKYSLKDIVIFHGRKNHDEIRELFEEANVGVVYIPMKKGYMYQPTTKFFEYLLSGMSIIATKTFENINAFKDNAGVLIEDNPRCFANGLKEIIQNKSKFNSTQIRTDYMEYTWEYIVKHRLEPYFEKIG